MGDSITLGRPLTEGYPEVLRALSGWGVANFGQGGDHVEFMATRYATVVANRGFTDVVFMGATNNATRGDNLATVLTNATTLWESIRISGTQLYICDITPRAGWGGHTQPIQDFVDGFNAGIAAYVATHPTVIRIPLYSLLEDPVLADHFRTDLIGEDGIHPTQAGQDFIGGIVYNYLRGLA